MAPKNNAELNLLLNTGSRVLENTNNPVLQQLPTITWSALGIWDDANSDNGEKIVQLGQLGINTCFGIIGEFNAIQNTKTTTGTNNISGVANAVSGKISGANNTANIGAILSGVSKESEKAAQEVKAGNENAASLEKSISNSIKTTQERVNKIIKEINEKAKQVEEKLKELEEHQKEKEAIEKELAAQKDLISQLAEIVNNPESKLDEKRAALAEISNAGQVINSLSERVNTLNSAIVSGMNKVESTQSELSSLNTESTTVIDNGQKEVKNYNTQLTNQIQANEKIAAGAAKNELKAAALEALAAKAEASGSLLGLASFGLGNVSAEVAAQKLREEAADNRTAAQTRTQGSATISSRLTTIGSTLNQYSTNLTNYQQNIVESIGSANTNINSYLDATNAFGSLLEKQFDIANASENIETAVQRSNDILDGKITVENNEEGNNNNNEQENNNDNKLFNYDVKELEDLIKTE